MTDTERRDIWQEIDCPNGNDGDLIGDHMVYQGQRFRCPDCRGMHTADASFIRTFIVSGDEMTQRELPKDADELWAWRSEFR